MEDVARQARSYFEGPTLERHSGCESSTLRRHVHCSQLLGKESPWRHAPAAAAAAEASPVCPASRWPGSPAARRPPGDPSAASGQLPGPAAAGWLLFGSLPGCAGAWWQLLAPACTQPEGQEDEHEALAPGSEDLCKAVLMQRCELQQHSLPLPLRQALFWFRHRICCHHAAWTIDAWTRHKLRPSSGMSLTQERHMLSCANSPKLPWAHH